MRSLLDRRAHISFHIQQMSFEAFFEGTGDNGSGKSARDGSPHRRCHFGEAAGLHDANHLAAFFSIRRHLSCDMSDLRPRPG
jgi:hypothetical protein